LDHAFYVGLYLAIIDRRDLSLFLLVHGDFYNTSINGGVINRGKDKFIDDFAISSKMA
jgi:hypothetical protein